jgi:hypothetical protein
VIGVMPPAVLHKVMTYQSVPTVIQFPTGTPRGSEFGADEMDQYGAKLVRFSLTVSCACGDRPVLGISTAACEICNGTSTISFRADALTPEEFLAQDIKALISRRVGQEER